MPPPIPYKYQTLTAAQAANEADVSPEYIRKLCRAGKIEWYPRGWSYDVSRPSFDRWKEAREKAGPRRLRVRQELTAA